MTKKLLTKIVFGLVGGLVGALIGNEVGNVVADYMLEQDWKKEKEEWDLATANSVAQESVGSDEVEMLKKTVKELKYVDDSQVKWSEIEEINLTVEKKKNEPMKVTNYNLVQRRGDKEDLAVLSKRLLPQEVEEPSPEDLTGPHIITLEQYTEDEVGYDNVTLMFYEEDDTLCGEDEQIIHEEEVMLGTEALTSFGKGSQDPHIVYVRNPKLKTDYEVIRSEKAYTEVVLGIRNENKKRHSPKKVKIDEEE